MFFQDNDVYQRTTELLLTQKGLNKFLDNYLRHLHPCLPQIEIGAEVKSDQLEINETFVES